MPVQFQTEYLFKRLSDFWSWFEDREDVKCVWDAYLAKANALKGLLVQADLSKSLGTIPLFDRNDLEYFIFDTLVRRTDREANSPFFVYEVDPPIFFVKNLNEKIDDTLTNRVLSPPDSYQISNGTGADEGKTFLEFLRGVAPTGIGETVWTTGYDVVNVIGGSSRLKVGEIVQAQNQKFYKVSEIIGLATIVINGNSVDGDWVRVQGPTVYGESIGAGDGATTQYALTSASGLYYEILDELALTGPKPPGVYSLAHSPYIPSSLELRKGATFDSGTPLVVGTHYLIVDPFVGTYNLTAAGSTLLASDQLHARYQASNPIIMPGSVKIYFDGRVVDPTDYAVSQSGIATFVAAPEASVVSITADYYLGYDGVTATNRRTIKESAPSRLMSRGVYRDRKSIYTNFGYAIGLDHPTSVKYLNEVRGIYFASYNGPTMANMDLGSGILVDIPFAPRGKVNSVKTTEPKAIVANGQLYNVVTPLTIGVSAGQNLARDFNLMTDGVHTADFISDPYLFSLAPLSLSPAKYFTFLVIVKGSYALYVATQTGQPIDYGLLKDFARKIKPSYTDCFVVTDLDFLNDKVGFFIGAVDATNAFDAAATLEFNFINFCTIPAFLTTNGFVDEVAAEASGLCDMDPDCLDLTEEVHVLSDYVAVETLENNLVNWTVSPPGPQNMDGSTFAMQENMSINDAIGTPPGSWNPPFSPGALLYSF